MPLPPLFVRDQCDENTGNPIPIPEGYVEFELGESLGVINNGIESMYFDIYSGVWKTTDPSYRHGTAKYNRRDWVPMVKKIL